MRTLSASLLAEQGLTVTRPGYLVSIAFSTPVYLSTLGDITWNGHDWLATDLRVQGLAVDERGAQNGTLSLGNADLAFGTLVLSEGVAERAIVVYAVWAGVVEPITLFSGYGDGCEVGDRVSIDLAVTSRGATFSPRRFINAASGFATLIPAGTTLAGAAGSVTLER